MGRPYRIPDPPPTREGKPFKVTGVDSTGALYVKTPEGENKVYIFYLLWPHKSCPLGVVNNLNVETFLQAFCRFVSPKLLPHLMLSDNALTYVAAAKDLEQLFSSPKL